jgi:hypothetical protein
MGYCDFVHLLSQTWLIVSDSGGIQEEATALGKPMIVLRENTERPEAVECGVARLVGESPALLREMLSARPDRRSLACQRQQLPRCLWRRPDRRARVRHSVRLITPDSLNGTHAPRRLIFCLCFAS